MNIGIVGGGCAGALVLVNLARTLGSGNTIHWVYHGSAPGRGVAYSTTRVEHLLNVRAVGMGAFSGEPDHFWRWLGTPEGKHTAATLCPGVTLAPDAYLPRMLYGAYLDALLQQALTQAHEKGIAVHVIPGEAVDVAAEEASLTLTVKEGAGDRLIELDHLVLATGNLPPGTPSFISAAAKTHPRFIANAWPAKVEGFYANDLPSLTKDSTILILGTGLTMADAALTLMRCDYQGKIIGLSRHGLLPRRHEVAVAYDSRELLAALEKSPATAARWLRILHAASRKTEWRAVIDALRPVTPTLWQRLATPQKKRFFAKLFTLWNVHRHRMAPGVADILDGLQKDGALEIHTARITNIAVENEKLVAECRMHNKATRFQADAIINCIQPTYAIGATPHPLLNNLLKKGFVKPAPLGMGLAILPDGTAEGTHPGHIHPIGNLRIEELLETTAVPELRDQAQVIATRLASGRR